MSKVLLVRDISAMDLDAQALKARGYETVIDPYIDVSTSRDEQVLSRVDELLGGLKLPNCWFILTSAAGIRALQEILGFGQLSEILQQAQVDGVQFAAVGPTSAKAIQELGVTQVLYPEAAHTAAELFTILESRTPGNAVIPRSSIGSTYLPESLSNRGWSVLQRTVYETTTVIETPSSVESLKAGQFAAVVFRSPSAARAVIGHCGAVPLETAVIATGTTTAKALLDLGCHVTGISVGTAAADIADCIDSALAKAGAK